MSMRKMFLMMVVAVAAVTMGLSSCSKEDDGVEQIENTPISKAQEVLENVTFIEGFYIKYAECPYVESGWFRAPDGKVIRVLVEAYNSGDDCYAGITLKESNSMNWAKFELQRCKKGRVNIVDTGTKDQWGRTVKDLTITIPKIKDETGAVAKNITLKYRGAIEKLNMLEY